MKNARPHTARSTVATIQDLSFECLTHPPYSTDPHPPPSDFRVYGLLKETMGGKSFRSGGEVLQAVQEWQRSQPRDFFFFLELSMHFQSAGTLYLHGTQWRLHRQMKSLCTVCVQ